MAQIIKKEIKQKVTKKGQVEKYERLTEVDRELLRVKADKTEENSKFNAELKSLREEQKSLLDVIDSGKETITVDCTQEIDEERMEVIFRRVDTGDVLPEFTRPMTPGERQMGFDDVPFGDGDGHEADDQEPEEAAE